MAILEVALTLKVLILNYLKRLNQTTLNKINLCLSISGIQRRSSEPILGTTSDLHIRVNDFRDLLFVKDILIHSQFWQMLPIKTMLRLQRFVFWAIVCLMLSFRTIVQNIFWYETVCSFCKCWMNLDKEDTQIKELYCYLCTVIMIIVQRINISLATVVNNFSLVENK